MSIYAKERPEWLRLSLDSVFQQTVPPDEVALVEDGPLTKPLYDVIEEYKSLHPELKVITFEKNRGLGLALRDGLAHCTHDIVARMDTDDICKPQRFEKELRIFEEHPETDLVSSWIDEFEGDINNIIGVRRLPETHEELFEFGKKRNPVSHPACMFRKEAVQKNGNYQDYPLFEDYFLWARLLKYGCRFYCIQESLLYFRRNKDMMRRRGGWHYAITEMRFQCTLYGIRYITLAQLFRNIIIRFPIRIIPNSLREYLYSRLRKK